MSSVRALYWMDSVTGPGGSASAACTGALRMLPFTTTRSSRTAGGWLVSGRWRGSTITRPLADGSSRLPAASIAAVGCKPPAKVVLRMDSPGPKPLDATLATRPSANASSSLRATR
ncbi:hypothetical protein [Pseudoduganella sp. UC29_71]|uniref:hypothetical protein n=1 Tax=Pseudoduganella sp. UC29_71 TaxID=3350174 RepID=UPI003671B7DE